MSENTWFAGAAIGAAMLCTAFLAFFSPRACADDAGKKGIFAVYDATQYRNKPDLSAFGFRPVNILYMHSFWSSYDQKALESLPDEALVRGLARRASEKNHLVILDIEHWSLDGDDESIRQNIAKYTQVIDWMRDERPQLQLGYFGIIPLAYYRESLLSHGDRRYMRWQERNDKLHSLASHVDIIFPYTYTYYPDVEAWRRFAKESINQARRYGKPVYVFLMPQYSEKSRTHGGQYISDAFWLTQLQTARCYADAAVIWSGPRESWDSNAPWWNLTRRFLRDTEFSGRSGCELY